MISILIRLIDAYKEDNKKQVRYICDGCQSVVEGKFIRVTEPNLTQPLDYCSEKCKRRNLSMDRLKFTKS